MADYYCLLQRTDPFRAERRNFGLVLIFPPHCDVRVRRCKWVPDRRHVNSVVARIRRLAVGLNPIDDIREYALTRANEIAVTEPRIVKPVAGEDDFERLWEELVLPREGVQSE